MNYSSIRVEQFPGGGFNANVCWRVFLL